LLNDLIIIYYAGYAFGEGVNSYINYRPKDLTALPCRYLRNPKIYLPAEALDPDSTADLKLQYLGLPAKENFEDMPGVIAEYRDYWFIGQSWRMLVDNWDQTWSPQCSTLVDENNELDFRYLIGSVEGTGEQLHYDGYAVIPENTVENPLADGGASLTYHHSSRWTTCANSVMDFTNIDSCKLSVGDGCVPVEASFYRNNYKTEIQSGVLVCGSHGEAGNNPGFEDKYDNNMFRMFTNARSGFFGGFGNQKGNVWSQIALEANDQLRQRISWALSQIFVVTPNQVRLE
jgi:hypothetical protein